MIAPVKMRPPAGELRGLGRAEGGDRCKFNKTAEPAVEYQSVQLLEK